MRESVSIHINNSVRGPQPACQMELEAEILRQRRGEAWRGREFLPLQSRKEEGTYEQAGQRAGIARRSRRWC